LVNKKLQRETLPEVLKLLLQSKCFCRTAAAATKLPSAQKELVGQEKG
jgi:hypothetical protein